ncbi:MAG: hypothetical protein OES69_16225 [Myxococcales bacterium]|nr:hypothetical protein [Myxococcales bacterium]
MSKLLALTKQYVREQELEDAEAHSYEIIEDIAATIGVRLREDQLEVLHSLKRWNFLSAHRRWGKSFVLCVYLWMRAYDCPSEYGNYAYFAATRGQTFKIVWRLFTRWAARVPGAKVLKAEAGAKAIEIPTRNGGRAKIQVEGLNYTHQRGDGWDGVIIDEAAEVFEVKYKDEILPALTDEVKDLVDCKGRENRWVVLCGTPLGRNWFYRQYMKALVWSQGQPYRYIDEITGEEKFEDVIPWTCAYLPVSITKRLKPEDIRIIRGNMDEESYLREFELDWRAASKGSFFGRYIRQLRNDGKVGRFDHIPGLPVHTSWDLGFTGLNVIWFFQKTQQGVRWIDAYVSNEEDLSFYLDKVLPARRKRYGYQYGIHYLPHDTDESDIQAGGSRMPAFEIACRKHKMGTPIIVKRHNDKTIGRQAIIWMLKVSSFNEAMCEESLDALVAYRRRPNVDGVPHGEAVNGPEVHHVDAIRQASVAFYKDWMAAQQSRLH